MELPTQESLLAQTNNKPVDGLPNSKALLSTGSGDIVLPSQDDLERTKKDNNPATLQNLNTEFKREDYEPILEHARPELGMDYLNKARALSQGNAKQFGNALWQSVEGTIVGETLQGIGAIGEIPEMAKDLAKGTNEADFSNWMMKLGDKITEHSKEVAPIYRENPNKDMDFKDWAYWMDNIPSVFSSISLMLPAIGMEKLGALALAKIGKMASVVGDIDIGLTGGKLIPAGMELEAGASSKYWAKVLGRSAFMRHGENVMEAHGLYTQAHNEIQDKFANDEEYDNFLKDEYMQSDDSKELRQRLTGDRAKDKTIVADYISSKAAWLDYKANSANYLFDVMEMMPLVKGFPVNTRANSWLNIADKVAEAEGVTLSKAQKVARGLTKYAGLPVWEALNEGPEEAINAISQKEGEYQYGRELGTRTPEDASDRMAGYLQDKNVGDQALWGFLGGLAFGGIMKGAEKVSSLASKNITQAEVQLSEIAQRKANVQLYFKGLADLKQRVADKKLTPEQAKDEFNEGNAFLASSLGFSASQAGNVDLLLKHLNSQDFRESMLKSIPADALKEIGVDDIDKAITHITDDVVTTEKLYKKAYNGLYVHDISETLKSKIAHANVQMNFKAQRARFENDKYENRYSELASTDNYLNNKKEDTAENSIQIKAVDHTLARLREQKYAAETSEGVGSPSAKRIRETIDEYEKTRNQLVENIGGEEKIASLTGMNPELQKLRNKMMWNEVVSKHHEAVAKDLLSDKFVKDAKKKSEEAKKAKEKEDTDKYKATIEKDIKDGKHTVATLTALHDTETYPSRKKFLKEEIAKLDNAERIKATKATVVTPVVSTTTPAPVVVPTVKSTVVAKTVEEKANEAVQGFDPKTANINYANVRPATGDLTTHTIANLVRANSLNLEDLTDLLDTDEYKNDPELQKLVKFAIARKLDETKVTPDAHAAKMAELDAEEAEALRLLEEGKAEEKKNNKIYGSIVPLPIISEKRILAIAKLVSIALRRGYYKFAHVLQQMQKYFGDNFNKAIFNQVRASYIQEIKERKAKGEDVSKYDNITEIQALQFEQEETQDTSIGQVFANLYLRSFGLANQYIPVESGAKVNPKETATHKPRFVTNAYKAVMKLKPTDKVVIIHDKNNTGEDTMEDRDLKLMTKNNIQIGYLNKLTSLKSLIDYANSLKYKSNEEINAEWAKVSAKLEENSRPLTGEEKMLLYKFREVNDMLKTWEKSYETFINGTLLANYNATEKLRALFHTGKSNGKIVEVEVGNITGGEFARIEPTVIGDVHGNNVEIFIVNPGTGGVEDTDSVDYDEQKLVSNKDSNKIFTKVNPNLVYRNTDAKYRQGKLYMLFPTFMSDPNDHRTWTPSPITISKVNNKSVAPVKNILAKIVKMQKEGTTFENEDFKTLLNQLKNYVVVRDHDAKNKLGVTINAGTDKTGKNISSIAIEFYHSDGKRYKAVVYAQGSKMNELGEHIGYVEGQSIVVYEEHLSPAGVSSYVALDAQNEEFVSYVDNSTADGKEDFNHYLNKILLSLPRSVNWKLLKSNEGVEGHKTYQDFLNKTEAWTTDVGKVFDHEGNFMGYTTPFGDNKLVVSLNPETGKSVVAMATKTITDEERDEQMKKCGH